MQSTLSSSIALLVISVDVEEQPCNWAEEVMLALSLINKKKCYYLINNGLKIYNFAKFYN